MRLFKKLRGKLDYLSPAQIEEIYQAYLTSSAAHKGQRRVSGVPYITHPIAVAIVLADMHMDHQSIIAALLHDVIEDTEVNKENINEQFGEQVADIVDGVSKLSQIEDKTKAEAQAEYFRKMILAMARDIRVILVKLADRLHNMRTLEALKPKKRRRIAKETLEIFAPIANRLGMHQMSTELEDLAFTALYPLRARVLREVIRKARGNRREILSQIEKSLADGLRRTNLAYCHLYGREKHLFSVYKKMHHKHLPFNDVMDVYAFRIVVAAADDCYRALGIVHSIYKPVPERFKDYVAIPKANGYQSLHTTLFGPYGVPIEIQIRTREMDERANSGIAAHWLYKTDEKNIDKSHLRAQEWVKNLLEMQQSTGSSLEFIENVKIDLFPDEVYVFTPKGKIMELPSGATVIDFAYAVHTDIGNTTVAAKIDRQLAPLSTVLSNGQTVEIITSPSARVNPGWLDFIVTGKARSAIRHYLKDQQHSESIALGKQMLKRALQSLSLSLKKMPVAIVDFVLRESGLTNIDDLYAEIGLGHRLAMLQAHRIAHVLHEEKTAEGEQKECKPKPLWIKGTEGMVVNFATCCYPIPGDPIVGILQVGKGIMIHMQNCRRVAKLTRHPEKFMDVRWSKEIQGEFHILIHVEIINERGALGKISSAIADAQADVDDISVNERSAQHYVLKFHLRVKNRAHLALVLRKLRKLKPVVRIGRGGE